MSSDAPDKWATARSAAAVAEWGSKGATAAAAAAAPTPAMRPLHLLGFSLGTVLNDCCASCWFNFLFVFLERVQGLSGSQVGAVFLTGQLSDAVATPLIGYLADRAQGLHVLGLGRRQIFYLLGVVIVSLSFVFVFAVCLPCVASPGRVVGTDERTLFFAAAAGVFNIGWAASQNSHQALVPELTPLESERVVLNSVRYAAFVASNILVLSSMFALLTANAFGPTPQTEDSPLTYSTLTGIVLGTGVCCAALFLALVRAPPPPAAPQAAAPAAAAPAAAAPGRTPLQWLRTAAYYKTAALYVTMRLGTNVTTLYMALFLTTTLGMEQGAIAAIPFVVFASSLGALSQLKAATAALGVRRTLCAGAGVFAAGSAAILLLPPALAPVMYGAAACLGVGLAAITVSVATLQSSLLGSDTRSAGFVFGSHSALDKLVVGVVVLGVQIASDAPGVQLGEFFRYTLGLAPLAAVGLCAALALSLGGGSEEAGAGAGAAGSGAPVVATPNPLAAAADAQGAPGDGQGKAGAAV